jgi:hypothetical protein
VNVKSEVPFKTCLAQLLLAATDSPRHDDVEAGGSGALKLREKIIHNGGGLVWEHK